MLMFIEFITRVGERDKCEACRTFYLFFATSLINSIIQEHECSIVMVFITFPVNLKTISGLSILLHGVISLPDATSYDKTACFNTWLSCDKPMYLMN